MPSFARYNTTTLSSVQGYTNIDTGLEKYADVVDSADPVYGNGMDGDATISSNTTLTSDKFYNNLTINQNITLNPGGYRIFVKNILTMNSGSAIGYSTGFSTAGSIAQGGAALTAVTHSLGGNGRNTSSNTDVTATAPAASLGGSDYYRVPHQAIRGWAVSASSTTPTFLRGGAGGTGQAGGGVVILAARYVNATNASVKAAATSPGGGGVILMISTYESIPSGISTDVTGYASGNAYYMQVV
jgi:hypothetical protein